MRPGDCTNDYWVISIALIHACYSSIIMFCLATESVSLGVFVILDVEEVKSTAERN